jgi:hypothetical protein
MSRVSYFTSRPSHISTTSARSLLLTECTVPLSPLKTPKEKKLAKAEKKAKRD